MKKWVVRAKKADFNKIAEKYNISPMLARIIRNRDITDDSGINMYLNGTVKDMHDPYLLKDMDTAVMLVLDAVNAGEKIFIIGDYDIDGICASYILLKGIKALGGDASVRLPDRVKDGYGMNMDMVDEAVNKGASLILTCDNGIAAYEEIKYAKERGLKVIVTDHHEVPYEGDGDTKEYRLPPADAVIDPKQEGCDYPFDDICGAMVAYKLIISLFDASKDRYKEEITDELLMFAGFATVGDIMDLKDENRIAVRFALEHMKTTKNQGMNCLIDVTGVDRNRMTPYTIGFILGPCINATGRLDSAVRALDMFLAGTHEEALNIALELKSLNDSRKDLTEKLKKTAFNIVDNMEKPEKILVIHMPDCHESLAGIIAGKVRETYERPVFILTGRGEEVKGSGRSLECYDMFDEMSKCKDLFTKFGGHKMAAGLSMSEANIDSFRKALNDNCSLSEEEMQDKLTADMELPLSYATMQLAEELDKLEPYGKGNPKPMFARRGILASDIRVFGKNRNVVRLKLRPVDGSCKDIDGIIFGDGDKIEKELKDKDELSIMYELDINEYMGNRNVRLIIKDYR